MIAERAFGAEFVELDVTFQNNLRSRGDFEVNGFAFDEIDGSSAQETCDQVFLNVWWRGHDGGECHGGVGADGDGNIHAPGGPASVGEDRAAGAARHDIDRGACRFAGMESSGALPGRAGERAARPHTVSACPRFRLGCRPAQGFPIMFRSNLLSLPVHSGGASVKNLHAVHAEVAFAGFRVSGGHAGESDEAPSVLRPALEDGEVDQREIVALDDFLAGAGGHGSGKKLSGFCKQRKHFQFVEEALRRFHVHEGADAVSHFIRRVHSESELHASFAPELVDEQLGAGVAFYILKEKSGASGMVAGVAAFADPIGDLSDL